MRDFPMLGHGIGLRTSHYQDVLATRPRVGWFEVISENFLAPGGNPRRVLRQVRADYPIVLHGVALSLGATRPLDAHYLERLAALARDIEPAWISDHLSWSHFGAHSVHDLWPLPFTEETLAHVATRILRVQDRLGRRILVENISSYVAFASSTMSEWQFLAALAERADCGLLLDVNNVYVSARNHGFDPYAFIAGIPAARVGQIHLAGHTDHGTHVVDTHDAPVRDEVWDLYRALIARTGPVATLIEWDDQIPPLARVVAESEHAARVMQEVGRVAA